MTNDPQAAAKSIFLAAADKRPEHREAYLEQACGDDRSLRLRVEALLRAHDDPGSVLEFPVAGPDSATVDSGIAEGPGTVIGHYKLLQQIGEGGMGVVYMAEQEKPVRRKVALKIIKPGMDSRQVIARFEAERQALAVMDHQHIARVLDAGATETGRPYFVMELVKGVPITEYCDNNKLTPRERLELFIPVCQAIHHAHQKGIIHRDVKPSNVLVCLYDGRPTPKVIDFGVAKAIEQRLTERTMFTQFGQIVGTFEYMSPEQAELSQLDVDTRSDVYSLGVLLYELLTGSTPITKEQLRQAAFTEMLRLIRESEPEKPSTRLSHSQHALPQISAQRRTEPERLGALLRGELDWIVMRSLEKDRTRRYESANELARDVERFLHDEVVLARPPSRLYSAGKLIRRHRGTALVGLVITALLAVFLVTHVVRYAQLKEARRLADEQALQAHNAYALADNRLQQSQLATHNAHAAELRAKRERDRAIEITERAVNDLSQSLFHQARALLASDRPSRRWGAIEALRGAESLRHFRRGEFAANILADDEATRSVWDAKLDELEQFAGQPLRVEHLRSQAVAALLLGDARSVRQWGGMVHAVSTDGRFAVSAAVDLEQDTGSLVITDLQSGETVKKWSNGEAEAMVGTTMALGPEARQLAAVDLRGRSIAVFDVADGTRLRSLTIPDAATEVNESAEEMLIDDQAQDLFPSGLILKIGFSPHGRHLIAVAVVKAQPQLVIWNLEQDTPGQVVGSLQSAPALAAFSADGGRVVFAAKRREIAVWNTGEGRIETTLESPLPIDGMPVFLDDRNILFQAMSRDPDNGTASRSALLIWDVANNREVRRTWIARDVSSTELRVSPDAARVAIGNIGGDVVVVDLSETAAPIHLKHTGMLQTMAWTPDSRNLLTGGLGSLQMWELSTSAALTRRRLRDPDLSLPLTPLAISPNGELLAVDAREAQQVKLVDVESGRTTQTLACDTISSAYQLQFSPDGRRLARLDHTRLTVWDLASGERTVEFDSGFTSGRSLFSLGFAADGRVQAGGTSEFVPAVWDVTQPKVIWTGERTPGAVVMLSPDGQLAAAFMAVATSEAESIPVYEVASGERRFTFPGAPRRTMQSMGIVSDDSRWLLAVHSQSEAAAGLNAVMMSFGGEQGAALASIEDNPWLGDIWNLQTGERHLRFSGPSAARSYQFSPDGRYLALVLQNGSVQVWQVERGEELFYWRPASSRSGAEFAPRQVRFTHDSKSLVVADPDRPIVHLLHLDILNDELQSLSLDWQEDAE